MRAHAYMRLVKNRPTAWTEAQTGAAAAAARTWHKATGNGATGNWQRATGNRQHRQFVVQLCLVCLYVRPFVWPGTGSHLAALAMSQTET